jgi:hypothetical protein
MIFFMIVGILLLIGAGVALWNRRTFSERMNTLRQAVPASTTDIVNAFPGEVVSITGPATPEHPLVSEQSNTPCVYYDFQIVRRYEQQRRGRPGVTVGGRDHRGRRRHRMSQRRTETVAQNEQWAPFRIADSTGEVRVVPDGAWFEARRVMDRYERDDSNNLMGIPGLDVNINLGFGGDRTLGYEIRENAIPTEAPVFVAGAVNDQGEIVGRSGSHRMIVSYRSGSALQEEWGTRERRMLIMAVIAAGLGALSFAIAAVLFLVSLI